jgi:hypothetical protein
MEMPLGPAPPTAWDSEVTLDDINRCRLPRENIEKVSVLTNLLKHYSSFTLALWCEQLWLC